MSERQAYEVTMTLQFPAWDEKNGITLTVQAKSKSDAIRQARREFDARGHMGSQSGRKTLRAVAVSGECANNDTW